MSSNCGKEVLILVVVDDGLVLIMHELQLR